MYIRLNSDRYKTLLVFILSFSLYFNGFSQAYAETVGGWSMGNPVAKGASTVYTGTRELLINGKKYIKTGTATILPVAADVSKVLARGVAGYALSVAVEQLLGAVDWVLDPENSLIRYTNVPADCLSDNQLCDYKYKASTGAVFINAYDACKANVDRYNAESKLYQFMGAKSSGRYYEIISGIFAPSVECTILEIETKRSFVDIVYPVDVSEHVEPEVKTIPLDTVSSKVISNAENGDTNAQTATTAAAADIVAEAEKDEVKARPIAQQLENSAQTKPADEAAADNAGEATGTTKPNSETGATDIALEFPIFCDWAPTICEAAQVVISFPQTLTNWWETGKSKAEEWSTSISESWTETKDWFKQEPETPEYQTPPEIPDAAVNISVTNYIQGSAYCPADRHVPLSMGGNTLDLVISYQPLCTVAQQFRPAVILMAFLAGAFIITNTGRRAETGD